MNSQASETSVRQNPSPLPTRRDSRDTGLLVEEACPRVFRLPVIFELHQHLNQVSKGLIRTENFSKSKVSRLHG